MTKVIEKVLEEQRLKEAQLITDKATFEEYKATAVDSCAALAEEGDSGTCLRLIADVQATISALEYDESKSLEENKVIIDAIVAQLSADLNAQRAKDILDAAKADFEAYKTDLSNACAALAEDGDTEACLNLIAEAQAAIAALVYDENKSLEDNKAKVDAIVEKLQIDLLAQREQERLEDIDNLNVINKPLKFLHNGQFFILRGDKVYTVTGQEVK